MELSPKANRYIVKALEHYLEHLERRLEGEHLSGDELSDNGNDREYIAALIQDFQVDQEDPKKT